MIRRLLAAALVLPAAALAQGVGAEDPRRPADAAAAPWASLVRVQTELGGRCTGALIAPRQVLTAAHCLTAPRTRRTVQPGSVHVLLGYDRGEFRAHARVAALRLGPGFDPEKSGPTGADWAVLTLATALPAPALPLLPGLPRPGMPALLGGWQRDRAHALLADTRCSVQAVGRDTAGRRLIRHDCAGTFGASGAPLLVRQEDGALAIAGVAVGAGRDRGGVAVAVAGLPLDRTELSGSREGADPLHEQPAFVPAQSSPSSRSMSSSEKPK